ncbi:MAG: FAD-binding dehydrogenase [Planctomycetaceae bacterium]|nr:FAD-binding dehydrogenase [Planctomycetaceae bacterium]
MQFATAECVTAELGCVSDASKFAGVTVNLALWVAFYPSFTRGKKIENFAVIIVGAGGSGLAAAASCAERGLKTLVLEKQSRIGGTTGIAIGSFTANRTKHQQRAGIDDSVDDHAEDAGKFPKPDIEARNNDELRRYFLSHTGETLDWLMKLGLNFHGPSPEPPNRVARMHNVVPNAKAYIATLQSHVLRHEGKIVCDAQVTELIVENDRVVGVDVSINGNTQRFHADCAVVLAAGDYANSGAMISRFKGNEYSEIEGINPNAHGDGHLLAESVGAELLNMDVTYGPELRFVPPTSKRSDFTQLLPSHGPAARILGWLLPYVPNALLAAFIKRLLVTWQHPEDSLFDDGAVLINQTGQRFCDETEWPDREIAVAQQSGKVAYILLDESLIDSYSHWPKFISTAPKIAYAYVADYLKMRPDIAVEASSIEALAKLRGIDARQLSQTVDEVNQQRGSQDSSSPSPRNRQLSGRRWVLLGPAKAYFTTTEGGAAIDQSFRVLKRDGSHIDGLYAVGQNGLGGQVLWGHGLHIGWAMTSGRLLGKLLADQH